jgi:predicted neuraminidase
MLIRVNGTGSLWRSDSDDLGLTWSPIYRTDIPNPGSKFDILTTNNRIILLHNPDSKVRNPLSLWVSSDDMQTWHKKTDLIRSRRDGHWICYPHAVANDASQTLYIASDAVKEFYLQIIPYGDFLS